MNRIRGAWSVILVVFAVGCSPLPGETLDPVYLKAPWRSATQESTQAPAAPSRAEAAAPAAARAQVWLGRFRDSRGEGDITFSLTRSQTTMAGTWRARIGGGGPLIATKDGSREQWQFRMENSGPDCPGTLEGSLEERGTRLIGTYRGRDCDGPVSDGVLDLHQR